MRSSSSGCERSDGPLVAILPGSRTQEVKSNFGYFLKAAQLVHAARAERAVCRGVVQGEPGGDGPQAVAGSGLPIEVHVGRTAEIIHAADCAMAVSGSVSLELLYHTKPTVILYYISRLAFFVQKFFRKVRYITLVNLLTTTICFPKRVATYDPNDPVDAHVLMPEYLTCEDKSEQVAAHVIEWLTDPAKRSARVAQLAELKEHVGHGGASQRAADYMLNELDAGSGRRCGRTFRSRRRLRSSRGARSGVSAISRLRRVLRIAD